MIKHRYGRIKISHALLKDPEQKIPELLYKIGFTTYRTRECGDYSNITEFYGESEKFDEIELYSYVPEYILDITKDICKNQLDVVVTRVVIEPNIDKMDKFMDDIKKFNTMYKLPCNDKPIDLGIDKMNDMFSIIQEEVQEFSDILMSYSKNKTDITILTELSDLLGDIVVYCNTFAKQWGIDMESTIGIIMQSNFSKLDRNGNVVTDTRGKVMKGENYWKPEPKIEELIIKQLKGE